MPLRMQEVEWRDGRLCYELVSGTGPKTGWVTVSLRGKEQFVDFDRSQSDPQSTHRSSASIGNCCISTLWLGLCHAGKLTFANRSFW